MARIGFFILLTIILVTNSATAQQTPQWGDMGNGNFRNPVIPSDYSDPDIIRVGDDYYGIASTFQFSPGMIVIHSKDLVNWTIINHIVDDISFLNPDLNWDKMKGYYNGIWAGSIRYHDGMFYCHFTTPRGGWFVATTTHPAKKWNVQAMKDRNGKELRGPGWDDNCPLWDDDGQAYIIASNFGEFWWPHLYKMSADGTTLLDGTINPNSVNPEKNMEIIGGYVTKPERTAEASKLYKWDGMYYFYFSEVREIHGKKLRVPMMLRSKSPYGPYEEKVLMESHGKEVDFEPNQGTIIDTPDGKDWYFVTQHGTGNFDGRTLSVLPVKWVDGWPLIGEDTDGDGMGEMVWDLKKPITSNTAARPQTDDDFSDTALGHQWEWNHQPRADKWSLTDHSGHLRLYAFAQLEKDDFFKTGNMISQRYIRWGKGVAIGKISLAGMVEGQQVGMAHFNGGKDYAMLCVDMVNGKRQLSWQRKQASEKEPKKIIANPEIPKNKPDLWIKTTIDFSGKAKFEYSFDNKKYIPLGDEFQLSWGNYRGSRIGFYTFNNLSDDGFADIDHFSFNAHTD